MAKKTKTKFLVRVNGSASSSRASVVQAAPQAPARRAAVAKAAGVKCPLCNKREAETELRFGPVGVKVCKACSQPVWHAMGLLNWFGR